MQYIAKWSFLKPITITTDRFNLASIESIAAMKVDVLFSRAKFRDYYDLYFLVKKKITIKKIFECSLNILDGITFKLFAVALVYIDDIEDDNIEYLEPENQDYFKETFLLKQKPDKLYLANSTLFNILCLEPKIGTIRESFFTSQVSVNSSLYYVKRGDFLIDEK